MSYLPISDNSISGTITNSNTTISLSTVNKGTVSVQINTGGTGTVNFEQTVDGTTWQASSAVDMVNLTNNAQTFANAAGGGAFTFNVAGTKAFRLRGAGISGNVPVTINASSNPSISLGVVATSYSAQAGAPWSVADTSNISIASTTSGQKGRLMMGAVTTAAPSYTTAQTDPISLTTAGGLRSDFSTIAGTTASVNSGAADAGTQRVVLATNSPVNVGQINAVTPLMGNGVTGTGSMRVTPASDATINTNTYATRTDTFTTTANGTTIDVSAKPMKYFTLQCKATGAVSSWTVVLEGSLDNVNFDTLITHTNSTPGDGKISLTYSLATLPMPMRYFRSRCSAIALGGGTNVIASILGMT